MLYFVQTIHIAFGGATSLVFNVRRGVFSQGQIGGDVSLTSHPRVVPKLRNNGAIPPLPQMFSCCTQRKVHFLRDKSWWTI